MTVEEKTAVVIGGNSSIGCSITCEFVAVGVDVAQDIVGVTIYLTSDVEAFTTGEVITVDSGYDRTAI